LIIKMIHQKNLIRKFWFDGRNGTTNYFLLFLAMTNFILITYNFLIEDITIFNNLLSNMWIYAIIFATLYFPISILIGRWHTNTQLHVDVSVKMNRDPIYAKMIRTLLDVQTGKASQEEIKEFRKEMEEIEKINID
tara:strand:- start:230 stop:637 length:408 start_codon:yes stop_codon:yes gene_type:complete